MVGSRWKPKGRGEERAWRGRRPCGRGPGAVAALGSLAGVLLLLAAAVAAPAQAAPGDLDLTFSGDGKQTTDFGFGVSSAAAIVRQPDGKIVAVGADRRSRRQRLRARPLQPQRLARHELLRRRQADDRLRGLATERPGWRSRATARSSWSAARPAADFALARYNPNGSLDTSFSGDGKQTTDFGGDFDHAACGGDPRRRQDRRGRFRRHRRAATSRSPATTRTARSTRASPATASRRPTSARRRRGERGGAPGRRQDRRGRLRRGTGARLRARPLQPQRLARHELLRRRQADDRLRGHRRQANGVALQGDGKIVAVGRRGRRRQRSRSPATTPNGSLDTSFSGDGKQTTDFGGDDEANGVALQGDGKIVAVGVARRRRLRARPLQPERLARHELLRRRQADDRLRGLGDGASGVALQADGKIVAVGAAAAPRRDFALARYNPNGSLDTSFSGDGKQTTDFGGCATGRTGWRSRATARSSRSAAPERHAATSRSPATTRTARSTRASPATASRRPTSGGSDGASGVALQATARSSRSAHAGDAPATTSRSPATTRTARSTRASPATASRRPTSAAGDDVATGVALQGDGKIVVVGDAAAPGDRLRARPLQPERLARHELLRRRQADDRLRRAATGRAGWRSRATARSSRSAGGVATATSRSPATTRTARSTRASPATASRRPTSGAPTGRPGWRSRRDGKIVAVGDAAAPRGDFALARYNPNGSLDTSFSGDGKQTTDFGGGDGANGVALQGDGKIVAVGSQRRRQRRLRARPLQPERLARHELLRRRQADDRLRRLRRGRTGWRSRATARSSRSATASAPTEPATSRSPAIWGAEPLTPAVRRWARLVSNQRPLACEASALPLSYAPVDR